jgi:hypothetical protein
VEDLDRTTGYSAAGNLAAEVEARRIAAELDRLYRDGAIATGSDAAFYARLLADFEATYVGRRP